MRLLALMTDAFGGAGGIARFNRDLLGALASAPQVERIDVACRHAPRRELELPPRVVQKAVPWGRTGYALNVLAGISTGLRHDVVLCGHLNLAPVAVAVARLRGIPLWTQLHGIEAWQRPGPLRAAAVEAADLVTAVSRYTRERFLGWADLPPDRVKVLPNTVGVQFSPGPKSPGLLERYALAGKKVLMTVSRLASGDRYKGHERVLSALRTLVGRRQDLVYLIVGDGDDRLRLEELTRSSGLAAHVRFAGQVTDREMVEIYRLADVFVMPSSGEGFGIAFVEAAASGVTVIGGNADGSLDALADGAIGSPVDPGDHDALVRAIETGLSTPARPADHASRFALRHFRRHVQRIVDGLVG